MGEWSDAVNDGAICAHCKLPLSSPSVTGGPTLCASCKQKEKKTGDGKIGPDWLPPRS